MPGRRGALLTDPPSQRGSRAVVPEDVAHSVGAPSSLHEARRIYYEHAFASAPSGSMRGLQPAAPPSYSERHFAAMSRPPSAKMSAMSSEERRLAARARVIARTRASSRARPPLATPRARHRAGKFYSSHSSSRASVPSVARACTPANVVEFEKRRFASRRRERRHPIQMIE